MAIRMLKEEAFTRRWRLM